MRKDAVDIKLSYDKTDKNSVSIKLRLTYNGIRKRLALPFIDPIICTKEQFDKIVRFHHSGNMRTGEEIRLIYSKISEAIVRAEGVIEQLSQFTFDEFKKKFYSDAVDEVVSEDILSLCLQRKDKEYIKGQITTGDLYEYAAKSLVTFIENQSLSSLNKLGLKNIKQGLKLEHISTSFLEKYEKWMIAQGNSVSTIGIYLRNIRSLYNKAITDKKVDASLYPFGKGKYSIPTSQNVKKAISKENILQLITYIPEIEMSMEQRSKDFYTFSYLSNGMNFSDILSLKWKDVDLVRRKITFTRNKTKNTIKTNSVSITVQLFDESINIIERWATQSRISSEFVFPFLNVEMDAKRQKDTVKQFVKVTNKYMRIIAGKLGIEDDPVTMSARHSFATILMQSNTPALLISKLLGHTDFKTTQNYLSSFEDEQTKGYLDNLL
ncbi:tyrosine-type recombinase/integrase [Flectobacillus sp. DC10W]|uniref:Tyrosine-type recombinase/integrase n=1 Tax=Flectobacillus longus TaxID=2984207 RepID=A0ABT6YLG2_9BACT|nr:tyrosine-type recombinase/integrase [Flectobacillus longus]MDI9864011.1 tyrosine-type recombinase/integrase [Flectobacillus longus]